MRLDRCLANSGYGSRSEVKALIKRGLVLLNGEVLTDPSINLTSQEQELLWIQGEKAKLHQNIHLMMYKPAGMITAMEDPRLPVIAGLLPGKLLNTGLFPVGRLDRDTTGLLILTNDGTFGHRLTGPRWQIWKTYRVTVSGHEFSDVDTAAFAQGLVLEDGLRCQPAKLEIIDSTTADLTIHEGKFHQVKRMMLATGRRVDSLHRWKIGPLELDRDLRSGEYRYLTNSEIRDLYQAVRLNPRY